MREKRLEMLNDVFHFIVILHENDWGKNCQNGYKKYSQG